MLNSDPLIRTKLSLPFIRSGLVSRHQLEERVVQGLAGPLTLIIASAGFGKTTLAASAAANCGMATAWLSLDSGDNQPGRFLNYLVAALRTVQSQIGNDAAQLMGGLQQAHPEAVLISLINDLTATRQQIVLVLDDYQFIHNADVHEQVLFLIEHCPTTFHLLIATRSDPPLPLARLRMRGQMVELRTADLRFTVQEATQFLNDRMGLGLAAELIDKLENHTEGWIAGLQMAALSMRDRNDRQEFIEGFSGTNRFILDYLLEEILIRQSSEIQHFLLCTSILERLCAPLCDSLLSDEFPEMTSASTLDYLERQNLFLISLDDRRVWFRYHHLFADLLRARLQQLQPGTVHRLHLRASDWLEKNGLVIQAIQHLLSIHEWERAADLIEQHGPVRWEESDPSVIQMADGLPRDFLYTRPKLGFYQAWYMTILGKTDRAVPLLNDMAQRFADAKPEQKWVQIMVGLVLSFLGQRASAPEFDPMPDDSILGQIPADETVLRDTAEILYGMTLGRRGEIDRAAEVAHKYIQKHKVDRRGPTIPTLVSLLTRIYLVQGRLQAAGSLCREYLESVSMKDVRFIFSAGSLNIVLGEVLYEGHCLEQAEGQIRAGLHANESWSDIMTDAWGLLALTRVKLAQKDFAGALQSVEKFEKRLQGQLRPHEFEEDFQTMRVRIQLASGDTQSAVRWANSVVQSEDFRVHRERYELTLAYVWLAQERYADVEEILANADPKVVGGNRISRQIEINLLRAIAKAKRCSLSEALPIMDECLALAEPEGYVQIFLNVGEPVQELLIDYVRSGMPAHREYAEKVMNVFPTLPGSEAHLPQPVELIDPLSPRELEVLQLLALGRTNEEIAQQLIVARGTVKAHAASIYRKLDASNRTEAVARARELGILP